MRQTQIYVWLDSCIGAEFPQQGKIPLKVVSYSFQEEEWAVKRQMKSIE